MKCARCFGSIFQNGFTKESCVCVYLPGGESKFIEGEVHEVLKIVGSGKSPRHDGQSYEL